MKHFHNLQGLYRGRLKKGKLSKTILKILSATKGKDDADATLAALDLLFSKKDREIINGFKLSMKDYLTLVNAAVALAMGEDPDSTRGE